MFQLKTCSYVVDNPYAWAMTVLDLSKIHLYKGWELVQSHFDQPKLIMVQTDSIYFSANLPNNDLYQKLREMKLDFSNLDKSHPLYNEDNAMVSLFWKLQSEGTCCSQGLIKSICSLRPKLYSILYHCTNTECETSKTLIKGLTVKQRNNTTHDDYIQKLRLNAEEWQAFQKGEERSWHALDVTRYLCPDHINTHAFGYDNLMR